MRQNQQDNDGDAAVQRASRWTQTREMASILAPAVLVAVAALWFASRFVEPAPPKTIAMSTGGQSGAYHGFGKRYAEILARSGVKLEPRPSAGSIENVRRLADAKSGVSIALLQGGITDAAASPELVSLGRIFLEPVWVFYRGGATIDGLSQLKGKRIAVGPEGSGTRALAQAMLKANAMSATEITVSPLGGDAAVQALAADQIDAVFLVVAPEAPLIQGLLREQKFKLMSFSQADAYTRLFPYLEKIVLPRGVVDLAANVPETDVVMLAASAALVARSDLHPALVGLLVDAVQEVHAGGGLFHRAGDFPRRIDPEFQMSADAERVYKSGQSFLKRVLPFWLANFIERIIIILVPIATLLLPLFKVVPMLYQWRIKRRIFYWYGQLKSLELRISSARAPTEAAVFRAEIDRIDAAVTVIPLPVGFSEQLFNLRRAVDLVRQRIHSRS